MVWRQWASFHGGEGAHGQLSSRTHVPWINHGIVSKRALVIPGINRARGPLFRCYQPIPESDLRTWIDPRKRRRRRRRAFALDSINPSAQEEIARGHGEDGSSGVSMYADVRRGMPGIYLPNYHGSQLVYRGESAEFNGS